MLARLGERFGFETRVVHPGEMARASRFFERNPARRGGRASSARGAAARTAAMRPRARSSRGHGIGSKQTVPTLNLRTHAQVLPRPASISRARADWNRGRRWNSITNVGYRPTFDGHGRN